MDINVSDRVYSVLRRLRRSELTLLDLPADVADQLQNLRFVDLKVTGYKDVEGLPPVPVYNVCITEYGRGYLDGRRRNDSRIRAASIRSWIAIVLSVLAIGAQIIAALISAGWI